MQNQDGGWSAFEKNTNKNFSWIPIESSAAVSTDPSTADLTGRTLEFLGNNVGLSIQHPEIERGVHWLLKKQERDGSWYGRWGISYIYGTWAAMTGMTAVGIPADHPAILKATQWLLGIQNEDGSWGESCRSDVEKKYIPLGAGTPSQTAWAVDALLSFSPAPTTAIERGIHFLIDSGTIQDWRVNYPTGAGLPGGFYFNFHSYRYIWPLIALGHYLQKFNSK